MPEKGDIEKQKIAKDVDTLFNNINPIRQQIITGAFSGKWAAMFYKFAESYNAELQRAKELYDDKIIKSLQPMENPKDDFNIYDIQFDVLRNIDLLHNHIYIDDLTKIIANLENDLAVCHNQLTRYSSIPANK